MEQTLKNRIAVVSKDPVFSSFFEWEAVSCGCPVCVLSEAPEDLSGYDVLIFDARAGYCVSEGEGCTVVTVLSEGLSAKRAGRSERIWEWPVSAQALRALYEARFDTCYEQSVCSENTELALYVLSEEERRILYRNREIVLSDGEWRLLRCLGDADGHTVTRSILGMLFEGAGNIVDVYIHALRKKLELPFGVRLIETERGVGYRLTARLCEYEDNT